MKTIKYLNIAASVLMLAACAKEELVPSEELIPVSESTTVTFVATDGTKTVLGGDLKTTSWDGDENVLLWEGETPLTIGEDNKSYEGGILTITADVTSPESTFYSVIGPEGDGNATRTSAAVLATQNPAKDSFDPNAEILVAQPATCGKGNTVALRYNRPVAITVATLKNLEASEKVLSVKITADKQLTGNVNFTYDGINVTAGMAGTGNTITCEYSADNTVVKGEKDEDGYVFPVYFISLNAEVMKFEFEVCTDKHKYYRKITRPEGSPIVLNDNRVAKFGFKLENADVADITEEKFVKVTSEPTDWSGEYLLVYEPEEGQALCWTGVDAGQCHTDVTIENNEIASKPEDAVTLEIASMTGGYSIKVKGGDKNGKFIGQSSYANGLEFKDNALLNTLEIATEGVVISGGGVQNNQYVTLRYNNNGGASNERFRYYKSGQQPVQLYKYQAGGDGLYPLHTPENIIFNNEESRFTWDAIENAESYTLKFYSDGNEENPYVKEVETNSYLISDDAEQENYVPVEYYKATVVAHPAQSSDMYKDSKVGTHNGWLKIGEPTMKKIEAKDIDVLAGARSLEITWPEQTLATNGYSSELWSVGEGRTKLQEKTEIAPDATSITYDGLEPNTKYRIYLTVKGVTLNDDRGERVYGDCTTYKDPSTAQLFTIAEITKAGSYAIENAVVVAKANDGFLVKDNFDENAGYIMVNKAADDLTVGDIVSVSGKVGNSNSQLSFGELSNYSKTGHNDSFVQPSTADKYTGGFEYLKYVNIIGKMTSSSGWLVTDATDNKLKVFANDKTGANKYVSVTGYLTHDTGLFKYLIATEIVEHTLTATPEELTWEATETDSKDVKIGINEGVDWTFSPTDNTDWTVTKAEKNTLKVSPNATNPSSTSSKSLTITLTHSGNTMLTTTIQCSQKPKTVVYEKYTDNLTEGYYLITYDNGAMKNSVKSDRLEYSEITPTSDKVTDPAVSIVWKIAKSGNYWTIYNESVQKYAASTGAKNQAGLNDSGTDDKSLWTVTKNNDGTFEFVNKKNSSSSVNANLRRNGNYGFACYATNIGGALTLYKLEDQRTPSDLAWSATTKELGLDDEVADMPVLSGHNASAATYSSSKTSVATVDASGNVIIVGVGETVIKANVAADDTYRAGEATYTLTVSAPERNFSATPVSFPDVPATGVSGQTVTVTASPKVVWSLLKDDGITVTSCTANKKGDNYEGSGVITFSVSKNTGLERELLLIVSTSDTYVGTKEYDVVISQNGAVVAKSFDVTESGSVNDVAKDGSTEIIHITGDSDVAWTASLTSGDPNAISFTGSGEGPANNSVVINANSGAARSFVITVSTTNKLVPEANRTHVITYNQAAGSTGKTYTITFANSASSATAIASTTGASTVIKDDGSRSYVTTKPFTINSGKIYYGDTKTCIRLSKSGESSSLSIALSDAGKTYAKKIVINCDNMGGSKNAGATLSVNGGTKQTTTETAAKYTFTVDEDITSITLSASAAVRIYSITVNPAE